MSRSKCNCMAQIHSLVNNCLGCGRVVCEREGSGPCLFCGNPVYPNNDEDMENERLRNEMENDPSLAQTYFVAVNHKSQLLKQDKDKKAARNLIDEDTDWYELKNDVWQSDAVRKQALQNMVMLEDEEMDVKDNLNIAFDFGEGKVQTYTKQVDYGKQKKLLKQMLEAEEEGVKIEEEMMKLEADRRLEKKEQELIASIRKTYKDKEEALKKDVSKITSKLGGSGQFAKVVENDDCYEEFLQALEKKGKVVTESPESFDRAFFRLTNRDTKCLSMWQPWASLLIWGFKRFEGRVWDTDYRGPLWIHAGAKVPDKETIDSVESQYRKLYQGVDLPPFPTSYPTGCLIGVIDLQDVIDQKVYTENVPKRYTGESTEEHLFVVRNPRRLMVNVKCVGNKGIFDLEDSIVEGALHTLKKVPTNWFPYYANNLPSAKEIEEDNADPETKQQNLPSAADQIKTIAEVETLSDCVIFKITDDALEKVKIFVDTFENANKKRLDKGKDGLLDQPIDKIMMPGADLLKECLSFYFRDIFGLKKEELSTSVPSKLDAFALSKLTKSFVLPNDYSAVLMFGRKCEFTTNSSKQITMHNGYILTAPTPNGRVKGLTFSKVSKNTASTGMQVQLGETLVFGLR